MTGDRSGWRYWVYEGLGVLAKWLLVIALLWAILLLDQEGYLNWTGRG